MDMISYLPDHLLIIIISFLTFQEAARTSVLSRRWAHIWRSTRNLDFNERFFFNIDADREVRRRVFVKFVENWIDNYQEPVLDKLCITFSRPRDFHVVVEECIEFAVSRGVKVLGLDFSDPSWGDKDLLGKNLAPSFDLPQVVYEHRVLESLTLFSCNFNVSEIINLRLLKNISLGWIELRLPSLPALLVNCPLLESLSLKNCWNADGLRVYGKDLRLRSLVVDKFIMSENPYIELEAPNLKYLKYSGSMAVFGVNGTRELEEAYLEFGLESEGYIAMGDRLYQLLHQLPTARVLTVCTYMLQVIPLELASNGVTPYFGVGHLTLKTAMQSSEQRGIRYFLSSCPCLQVLIVNIVPQRIIVDLDEYERDNVGEIWALNAKEYHCVNQTLKVVQVKGFKGTRHEVGLLRYLFCCGSVLEKLHILVAEKLENQHEVRQLLGRAFRGLKKASNDLHISIYRR
ncbi:hypothetical protein M0R45_020326 [Rubus argutus]|uniref:F-box domain-containing protein n=1 Tax=Rubus argutus TaxID=59490 RepID=A0AAW1XB87_RUBAR